MNTIVQINNATCTGCGACVALCPRQILFINEKGVCDVTDEKKCDRLRGCQRVCPSGAIVIR